MSQFVSDDRCKFVISIGHFQEARKDNNIKFLCRLIKNRCHIVTDVLADTYQSEVILIVSHEQFNLCAAVKVLVGSDDS